MLCPCTHLLAARGIPLLPLHVFLPYPLTQKEDVFPPNKTLLENIAHQQCDPRAWYPECFANPRYKPK